MTAENRPPAENAAYGGEFVLEDIQGDIQLALATRDSATPDTFDRWQEMNRYVGEVVYDNERRPLSATFRDPGTGAEMPASDPVAVADFKRLSDPETYALTNLERTAFEGLARGHLFEPVETDDTDLVKLLKTEAKRQLNDLLLADPDLEVDEARSRLQDRSSRYLKMEEHVEALGLIAPRRIRNPEVDETAETIESIEGTADENDEPAEPVVESPDEPQQNPEAEAAPQRKGKRTQRTPRSPGSRRNQAHSRSRARKRNPDGDPVQPTETEATATELPDPGIPDGYPPVAAPEVDLPPEPSEPGEEQAIDDDVDIPGSIHPDDMAFIDRYMADRAKRYGLEPDSSTEPEAPQAPPALGPHTPPPVTPPPAPSRPQASPRPVPPLPPPAPVTPPNTPPIVPPAATPHAPHWYEGMGTRARVRMNTLANSPKWRLAGMVAVGAVIAFANRDASLMPDISLADLDHVGPVDDVALGDSEVVSGPAAGEATGDSPSDPPAGASDEVLPPAEVHLKLDENNEGVIASIAEHFGFDKDNLSPEEHRLVYGLTDYVANHSLQGEDLNSLPLGQEYTIPQTEIDRLQAKVAMADASPAVDEVVGDGDPTTADFKLDEHDEGVNEAVAESLGLNPDALNAEQGQVVHHVGEYALNHALQGMNANTLPLGQKFSVPVGEIARIQAEVAAKIAEDADS